MAEGADLAARVAMMTTTHFTLATRRASTVAEANGRDALFLSSVSMSLVAFGFLAQATGLGPAFFVLVHVLLLCLLAVGAMTFERVLQTGIEDRLLADGEARARAFYAELAPDLRARFVLPVAEGDEGFRGSMAAGGPWQVLLTAASMVAVVNATILGVLAGLLALRGVGLGLAPATALGVAAFGGGMAGQVAWQVAAWSRATPR